MKTIEEYVAAYQAESDLDLVARNLTIDGADGGTITRVIARLRFALGKDPRDYPGYSAMYQALHQANPHLAHEFHLCVAEAQILIARGDRDSAHLDDIFRYYSQELARSPKERSAGIPPGKPQSVVDLG